MPPEFCHLGHTETGSRSSDSTLGQPEDVAKAVVFLCSPRARHIQGVGFAIDGGATPGL
ncbi:SDR family oxidoreductase [Microbaculum sp. FT89]|uniref:SDR family oxidoreductase n=1 Tax=Microbaculum sp. FT89 TaxID=3447298 RepID=UPI003F52E7AC